MAGAMPPQRPPQADGRHASAWCAREAHSHERVNQPHHSVPYRVEAVSHCWVLRCVLVVCCRPACRVRWGPSPAPWHQHAWTRRPAQCLQAALSTREGLQPPAAVLWRCAAGEKGQRAVRAVCVFRGGTPLVCLALSWEGPGGAPCLAGAHNCGMRCTHALLDNLPDTHTASAGLPRAAGCLQGPAALARAVSCSPPGLLAVVLQSAWAADESSCSPPGPPLAQQSSWFHSAAMTMASTTIPLVVASCHPIMQCGGTPEARDPQGEACWLYQQG